MVYLVGWGQTYKYIFSKFIHVKIICLLTFRLCRRRRHCLLRSIVSLQHSFHNRRNVFRTDLILAHRGRSIYVLGRRPQAQLQLQSVSWDFFSNDSSPCTKNWMTPQLHLNDIATATTICDGATAHAGGGGGGTPGSLLLPGGTQLHTVTEQKNPSYEMRNNKQTFAVVDGCCALQNPTRTADVRHSDGTRTLTTSTTFYTHRLAAATAAAMHCKFPNSTVYKLDSTFQKIY